MWFQVGVLVICGAVPGLLLRRFGPWAARLGALVALLAIGLGILNLPRETLTSEPAVVAVVPTGKFASGVTEPTEPPGASVAARTEAATEALRRELLGEAAGTALIEVRSGGESVADRLATARLGRAEEPSLVLLWTGPPHLGSQTSGSQTTGSPPTGSRTDAATDSTTAERRSAARPGRPRGRFLSDGKATPFDPDQVELQALTRLAVGRPGALRLRLPDVAGAAKTRVQLRITDVAGKVALDHDVPGAAEARIDWVPENAGSHNLILSLEHEGVRFAGRGTVEVAAPPTVVVVGARAENMVRTLAVQGIVASAVASVPAEPTGILVVLDPLPPADQQRVATFLREGGGVLLVGAARGGAVPGSGEPLAALCPVVRLPLPDAKSSGEGEGGGGDEPADQPPAKSESPPPIEPPEKPPEGPPPPEQVKPGAPPEKGATGATKGARKTGRERVVERRSIAMVLLVDGSGSMDELVKVGVKRIDIARASALQTALALDEEDEIGVVSFGERNAARIELPMTAVKQTGAIKKALSGLHASARETRVRDGLRRARELLKASKAPVKYVIVVTDGVITDVRDAATHSEARKCGAAGVTIVVVQVLAPGAHGAFDAASQTLALVQRANGQLVQQRDFDSVPKIISSEVERIRTAAGRPSRAAPEAPKNQETTPTKKSPPAKDGSEKPKPPPKKPPQKDPPTPKTKDDPKPSNPPEKAPPTRLQVHIVEDAALLDPLPASGQFPPVGGILPVRGRADARTLLAAGPDGLPLLALANRGLGRVAVWTADLYGPWGEEWAKHPGFPGWMAQWVTALTPAASSTIATSLIGEATPGEVVLVPRLQAALEGLMHSPVAPVASFVVPPPRIRSEVEGAAADHAWYGALILVFLAGLEFLSLRRRRRGGSENHAHR